MVINIIDDSFEYDSILLNKKWHSLAENITRKVYQTNSIYDGIVKKYVGSQIISNRQIQKRPFKSIALRHCSAHFALLLVGEILSTMAFGAEILKSRA